MQPSAQPDCDETQTVRRSWPCRISTVSSGKPSRVRKRALIVPSVASCVSSSTSSANGTASSSRSRRARDSVETSSQEVTRSRVTACRTWAARYAGSPQAARASMAASRRTPTGYRGGSRGAVAWCRPCRSSIPSSRSTSTPTARTPDALLAEMEAHGERDRVPIVPPETGALLHVLARAAGARRIVEVGTAIGVSTLYLARALPADGGS